MRRGYKSSAKFNSPSTVEPKLHKSSTTKFEDEEKIIFNVIWAKISSRKHKKWEDDAFLIVRPLLRSCILQDSAGSELCRNTGMSVGELENLNEGSILSFGGKEIEILERLSNSEYEASLNSTKSENLCSVPKSVSKVFAPFKPIKRNLSTSNSQVFVSKEIPSHALFLPTPNYETLIANDISLGSLTQVMLDPYLSKHLRPHQRDGIVFLYECVMGFKIKDYYGAILADEMGLGKTLMTISLIWTLLRQSPFEAQTSVISRALIVCPSSLVSNWAAEFQKWLGSERISVYPVDSSTHRIETYIKNPRSPVLILSYEMFTRSFEALKILSFGIVIADEGHKLKNTSGKAFKCLQDLETKRRVLLSGTPLQNDLKEFLALVSLVNPGILRDARNEKCRKNEKEKETEEDEEETEEDYESLKSSTSPFILRRTQDVLSSKLPPKSEFVLFCRPSSFQRLLYNRMLDSILTRREVFCEPNCAFACIAELRKLCNHPSLVNEDEEGSTFEEQSGKLAVLSLLLHSSLSTSKFVIVSLFTKVLDLLQELCAFYNYAFLRLDGSTSPCDRGRIVNVFNSSRGKERILLLSSKAGGTGLNLIGASKIVLYDNDWNPAVDNQAMARIWRDGQKSSVTAYRLLTTGTIEEKIFQRQMMKKGLEEGVFDGKASKSHFTSEELKDLFSFSEETDCQTHELIGCDCSGTGEEIYFEKQNTRRCQLGASSLTKPSITNLKRWKHIKTEYLKTLKDDGVEKASDFISYVFQNNGD